MPSDLTPERPVRLDDPWRKVAFYFLRKLPDATELPVFSANDDEVIVQWRDRCWASFTRGEDDYSYVILDGDKFVKADTVSGYDAPIPQELLDAIGSGVAAAEARGRREGVEAAAKVCDALEAKSNRPSRCAREIRALSSIPPQEADPT